MINNSECTTLPYVVQEHHEGRVSHWDLMLHRPVKAMNDDDRILATWKLELPPKEENLNQPIQALELPDHRRAYLTYEGPIHQGRLGWCQIVDRGHFHLSEESSDHWRIIFDGQWLKGEFDLKKMKAPRIWTLVKSAKIP